MSDLSNKIRRDFFQAAFLPMQLYGCTTRSMTKRIEKKLDGNKKATSYTEQILEVTPYENTAVRTVGGARTNLLVTFFLGTIHRYVPALYDQQEHIYMSTLQRT